MQRNADTTGQLTTSSRDVFGLQAGERYSDRAAVRERTGCDQPLRSARYAYGVNARVGGLGVRLGRIVLGAVTRKCQLPHPSRARRSPGAGARAVLARRTTGRRRRGPAAPGTAPSAWRGNGRGRPGSCRGAPRRRRSRPPRAAPRASPAASARPTRTKTTVTVPGDARAAAEPPRGVKWFAGAAAAVLSGPRARDVNRKTQARRGAARGAGRGDFERRRRVRRREAAVRGAVAAAPRRRRQGGRRPRARARGSRRGRARRTPRRAALERPSAAPSSVASSTTATNARVAALEGTETRLLAALDAAALAAKDRLDASERERQRTLDAERALSEANALVETLRIERDRLREAHACGEASSSSSTETREKLEGQLDQALRALRAAEGVCARPTRRLLLL